MRSEQHRKNVAELPCAACGLEGHSQAAHSNDSQFGKGARLKADDFATFPLCAPRLGILGCHYKHDNYLSVTREERPQVENAYIAQTLMTLLAQGKLKVSK